MGDMQKETEKAMTLLHLGLSKQKSKIMKQVISDVGLSPYDIVNFYTNPNSNICEYCNSTKENTKCTNCGA